MMVLICAPNEHSANEVDKFILNAALELKFHFWVGEEWKPIVSGLNC